jgi:hypothetical protein
MSNRVSNGAVFALALVLIVGGAWGIWRGSDYIQLERGWASVISGSVAATGGVLALAIGFVLRRLDGLHRALLAPAAGAGQVAPPLEAPFAAPRVEPMPANYAAPALEPVAAVPLGEAHPAAAEAPPEVIHAAQQGPADDMAQHMADDDDDIVKAAGVSDEPELDAAIEELLAEERGRGSDELGTQQALAPAFPEISAEAQAPPVTVTPEAPEKAPQRMGWRGLFSRKERRAAAPSADPSAVEAMSQDKVDASIASQGEALAENGRAGEPGPARTDTIPRTGDDWFDRALSGLDEIDRPYQPSGTATEKQRQAAESSPDMSSGLEVSPGSAREAPGATAPGEPAIIGRYTSGNTTYIMFDDGSIEAETPTGILRFASLAELKSYVEGGQ